MLSEEQNGDYEFPAWLPAFKWQSHTAMQTQLIRTMPERTSRRSRPICMERLRIEPQEFKELKDSKGKDQETFRGGTDDARPR